MTSQDAYLIPRRADSLEALSGSNYFITLELMSGYWRMPLDADAHENSAFSTRFGLWQWKARPSMLTSASATFQRFMERLLQGLHSAFIIIRLHNYSIWWLQHLFTEAERLFKRLRAAGLRLKFTKCEILKKTKVFYLNHIVSAHGAATYPAKVEAVKP